MGVLTPTSGENFPEEIPESGAWHLPGTPAMRKQVRHEMARSGFKSDARRADEIVHTPTSAGAMYDMPGRFGVYHEPRLMRVTIKQSKEIFIAVSQLAAHSIHIIAIFNDQNSDLPGLWLEVEYEAADGKTRTIFDRIEAYSSEKSGGGPWDEMARFTGISERDIKALQRYLSTHIKAVMRPGGVIRSSGTSRLGWSPDFSGYARPGYTRDGLRALCPTDAAQPWTASGDIKEQRRVLLDLLRESPRAAMAMGFAAAGLLMRPLGISENYLLAMVGPDSSSLGKTSLMLAIKSLWGAPDKLKTFDSTSKALRASAIDGNDSTVLIDEVGAAGRTDPREQDALVYGLAAGVARDRLVRQNGEYAPAKESAPARYTALITGERSLINKESARKGILIRYSEIEVSPQKRLWSFNDAARMERAMNDLRAHHGHIYPAMIDLLIENPGYKKALQDFYMAELERVRERCSNEKQKRKARLVALTRTGLHALSTVLDPRENEPQIFYGAMIAADELLDDYIDNETVSETAANIGALPLALAQHLAVATEFGAKMPTKTMVGSMWPNELRYRAARFGDVKSISSDGPGEEIKGTVITLNAKLAGTLIRDKLCVDIDALVREAVRHGLVKLNAGNNGGWRSTSMTRFIIDESGSTSRSRGIEIMIPEGWEPPETETKPKIVIDNSFDDPDYEVDLYAARPDDDHYDNNEPPF